MQYKVRKMTVWQRLHVLDAHTRFRDEPFTVLGIVLKHGLMELDGEKLSDEEVELIGGKKCRALTDEALARVIDKYGLDLNIWDDVLQAIYKENLIPFTETSKDNEP